MSITRNIRSAAQSLKYSKWRSLMTMTGVILGVLSVITIVSIGEGVKRQVVGQINLLGSDLISVRPGNLVTRDKNGNIVKVNQIASYAFGSGSMSDSDLETIKSSSGVKTVVPIGLVNSGVKLDDVQYNQSLVIATNDKFPAMLKQTITHGVFFDDTDSNKHVVVIGKRVAENLFAENVPIGRTLTIRGVEFVVIGVFEEFNYSPLAYGTDLNQAITMPYAAGQELTGHNQLAQVLVRPESVDQTTAAIASINKKMTLAHGGQNDFTVLKQDENLSVVSDILKVFTAFISGVAAMSLLIGGIGIMNIMLVSVTERTREIGIRKAIGATNRQISEQFFVEATILSSTGGAIGIGLAFVVNAVLRIVTHLNPVISLEVVLISAGVSIALGIVFGVIPAVRAARKDPIEALRYE